jgi:cytochrome c-type biogenesis protein CcmH
MRLSRFAVLLGAMFCLAAAADPADRLANPDQEARARALFRETRCLVCQGESIDDSDADLAGDLRRIVRSQIAAGRSDAQVRRFLVERYGEFVLLRPVLSVSNALLWGGPFLVAIVGLGWLVTRRRSFSASPPLSPEEEARIRSLQGPDGGDILRPEISSKSAARLTER